MTRRRYAAIAQACGNGIVRAGELAHGGRARERLHHDLAALIAGHELETAWACLADALGMCIALSAKDEREEKKLCRMVGDDLMHFIHANRDLLAAARARVKPTAGGRA